jgi:hypothetical protein
VIGVRTWRCSPAEVEIKLIGADHVFGSCLRIMSSDHVFGMAIGEEVRNVLSWDNTKDYYHKNGNAKCKPC